MEVPEIPGWVQALVVGLFAVGLVVACLVSFGLLELGDRVTSGELQADDLLTDEQREALDGWMNL